MVINHPRFLILISLLALFVITTGVSASTTPEWTSIFNTVTNGQYGIDVSHYNISVQMAATASPNTQPWELWILSGFSGIVLFLMSLKARTNSSEVVIDGIISVLAWMPIAFCAYASFGIDRIVGYGVTSQVFNTTTQAQAQFYNHEYVYMENHLVYTEPVIGILMFVFLLVAIGNTLRIISLHNALKGKE